MFSDALQKLGEQNLLRQLSLTESPTGPVISVSGQSVLLFASNDYLGLANHPKVKLAAHTAIDEFGVGTGASRLISGSLPPHHQLEQTLAQFKGTEASLIFSSGYAMNLGIIPCLMKENGLIFADRLCHASLIDGSRLSRATLRVFHHNDLEHLRALLSKRDSNRPTLIITEGVFSMDGDLAPLNDLADMAKQFQATLLIDDAHGTGVMGATGSGSAEHFGVKSDQVLQVGTLSKAIGASGGFITGTNNLVSYLINTSRSFIYTTAPPPSMAAAAEAALAIIQQEPERRTKLWLNREHMFQGLTAMGYRLTHSESPILPIMMNNPQTALTASRRLREEGLYIPAIRPPTIPNGSGRLRVTVTAEHSIEQIETALETLQHVGTELRII